MRDYALTFAMNREAAGGASIFGKLFRNWAARRAVARLDRYDDHILADIGLTRGDIRWASKLPLSVNAALSLEDRANRQRVARRAG